MPFVQTRKYGEGGKGRPPTSGTRRGNGRGWGGPARGAHPERGARQTIATTEESAELRAQQGGPAAQERAAKRAVVLGKLFDIVTDPTEPTGVRLQAAEAVLDRINGKPARRRARVEEP